MKDRKRVLRATRKPKLTATRKERIRAALIVASNTQERLWDRLFELEQALGFYTLALDSNRSLEGLEADIEQFFEEAWEKRDK